MAYLTVNLESENAAFEELGGSVETVRILRELAKRIENAGLCDIGGVSGPLIDQNGNRVGDFTFEKLEIGEI